MESLLTLMSFEDSAPVAYVDAYETGRLSQRESLALVRAAAEEHGHDRQ
ncbi:hypothetical protein AB0929_08570 [Streptomyces massasporeus]